MCHQPVFSFCNAGFGFGFGFGIGIGIGIGIATGVGTGIGVGTARLEDANRRRCGRRHGGGYD